MPFGKYPDFNACVLDNKDKTDPAAFCAWLEKQTTGKWPGDKNAQDIARIERLAESEHWQLRNGAGIRLFAGDLMKTRSAVGVEIMGTGTHNGDTFTTKDLDVLVSSFQALRGHIDPPLKVGHTSDEFNLNLAKEMGVPEAMLKGENGNGVMALGWLTRLRRVGDVLEGDFSDVPEPIARVIESRSYKKVSSEIRMNYDRSGKVYPMVLTGVAILGAELPAAKDIKGLEAAAVFTQLPAGGKEYELDLMAAPEGIDTSLWNRVIGAVRKVFSGAAEEEEVFAAYPWDQCIADQMARYGNKETAQKVCASIRAKSKGLQQVDLAAILRDVEAELKIISKNKEEEDMKKVLEALGLKETATELEAEAAVKLLTGKVKKFEGADGAPGVLQQICTALGLKDTATIEEIVAAINGLKGQGGMKDRQFTDLQAHVTKLQDELNTEKRKARVTFYTETFKGMKAISGKPEEMAEKLVKLEEKDPARATELLADYDAMNKQMLAAGVVSLNGTPAAGSPGEHEFFRKVREHADKEKVDEAEAFNAVRKKEDKLYRDYMKSR